MSKMSIERVIKKCFIVWGKTFDNNIKIVCKWTVNDIEIDDDIVVIDYDKHKREWYVMYFKGDTVYSCTVDDISGSHSMTTFKREI